MLMPPPVIRRYARGGMAQDGDSVQLLASGVPAKDAIVADLFGLTHGTRWGRHRRKQGALVKSAGTAFENFTAAVLVYQRLVQEQEIETCLKKR
jgi:ornithine cyclodeaminase/alanine dehydrogenase-like protein (mu-crystallin family)